MKEGPLDPLVGVHMSTHNTSYYEHINAGASILLREKMPAIDSEFMCISHVVVLLAEVCEVAGMPCIHDSMDTRVPTDKYKMMREFGDKDSNSYPLVVC